MDDEDWLEGPVQGQGATSDPLVEQEWQRMANKYSDAGYREGITDGKLSTLQQGFDQGYALSATLALRVGSIRGRLTAFLQHLTASSPGSTDLLDEVRNLINEVSRVRRDDILPIDLERLAHEREHGEEGYELDNTAQRDMESIEAAMDGLGGRKEEQWGGRKGEELLLWLEGKVGDFEQRGYRI